MRSKLFGLIILFLLISLVTFVVSADDSSTVPVSPQKVFTLEDVLIRMHSGQWFGWSDSENKVYETLVVLDKKYSKPLKSELFDLLDAKQSNYDSSVIELDALKVRIKNHTANSDDVLDYLAILGGF